MLSFVQVGRGGDRYIICHFPMSWQDNEPCCEDFAMNYTVAAKYSSAVSGDRRYVTLRLRYFGAILAQDQNGRVFKDSVKKNTFQVLNLNPTSRFHEQIISFCFVLGIFLRILLDWITETSTVLLSFSSASVQWTDGHLQTIIGGTI